MMFLVCVAPAAPQSLANVACVAAEAPPTPESESVDDYLWFGVLQQLL